MRLRAADKVAFPLVVSAALIRMSPIVLVVVMVRSVELRSLRVPPSVRVLSACIVRGPAAAATVIGPEAVVVRPLPVDTILKGPLAFKLRAPLSVRSPAEARVEVPEEPP